jgi:peptide/nickel transport system permease protein
MNEEIARTVLGSVKSIIAWITKSKARIIGITIIAALIVIAVFYRQIMPYELNQHFGAYLKPSTEHLLGTDDMGRDIFSEMIYGTRISLAIGFLAATISLTIGVTLGVLAGYYRGKLEGFILAATDLTIVIPSLPLLLIIVSYFSRGIVPMAVAISILGWSGMVRVIHPRVLSLRESPFIESAKAFGKSDAHIIVKHILVNCKDVIATKYSLAVGSAIMAESSLAFLGLGDPLHPSWGGIINEAYSYGALSLGLWWWYMVPALLISVLVIAFMFIGQSQDEDRWIG